jgi:hypothetical protein
VASNDLAVIAALLSGGAACGTLAPPPEACADDANAKTSVAVSIADTPLHTALRLGRLRAAAALLAAGASLAAEDAAGTHTQTRTNTRSLLTSLPASLFQAARPWIACPPPSLPVWRLHPSSPLPAAACAPCLGGAAPVMSSALVR